MKKSIVCLLVLSILGRAGIGAWRPRRSRWFRRRWRLFARGRGFQLSHAVIQPAQCVARRHVLYLACRHVVSRPCRRFVCAARRWSWSWWFRARRGRTGIRQQPRVRRWRRRLPFELLRQLVSRQLGRPLGTTMGLLANGLGRILPRQRLGLGPRHRPGNRDAHGRDDGGQLRPTTGAITTTTTRIGAARWPACRTSITRSPWWLPNRAWQVSP